MATPEEVPWLDAGEHATWIDLVGLLIHLPAALDAQLRRDAGLSHFEYQVLAALSTADDRTLRMSELADLTEGSLSRLSHVAQRLADHGWVRRHPDPDDGRVTLATLTDAGHAKIADAAPGHVRAVRRYVFDPLTEPQVRQLGRIARSIQSAVDEP